MRREHRLIYDKVEEEVSPTLHYKVTWTEISGFLETSERGQKEGSDDHCCWGAHSSFFY